MAFGVDDRIPKGLPPQKGAVVTPPNPAPAESTAAKPSGPPPPAKADVPGPYRAVGAQKGRPVSATETEKAANEKAVASWNGDWRKALTVRPPAETAALQNDAIQAVKTAQANFTKENGSVHRAQHAKAVYATTDGKLHVPESIPDKLAFGPFKPGADLRAMVRISNVSGVVEKDGIKDLRGFALRLTDDKGHVQDLTMNTSEEFMAKDAVGAIVGFRVRGEGVKELPLAVLSGKMGLRDAWDLKERGEAVVSNNTSVAAHTFWSRTPFQLGDQAVKIRLVPVDPHSQQPLVKGDDNLSEDMRMRLQHEPVKYMLQVQGYKDEKTTPINDARDSWGTEWVSVGELTLPELPKDSTAAAAQVGKAEGEIDKLAFSIGNRWSQDDSSLKGIGDINSIREKAYKASAEGRGVTGMTGLRCPRGFG